MDPGSVVTEIGLSLFVGLAGGVLARKILYISIVMVVIVLGLVFFLGLDLPLGLVLNTSSAAAGTVAGVGASVLDTSLMFIAAASGFVFGFVKPWK